MSFLRNLFLVLVSILLFINYANSQTIAALPHQEEKDSLERNYDFIVAASNGDVKKVKEAINRGVNINYKDADGATAIFYAASNSHIEILKLLLYYGANQNIATYKGLTPLMEASKFDFDIANLLLLKQSTKVDLHDVNNLTALHYAAYYGQYYIVDMLLFYGANANNKTLYGTSALLLASYSNDTAMASLLINAGNCITKTNRDGMSPLKVAIQNNDSLLFYYYVEHKSTKEYVKNNIKELLVYSIKNDNTNATEYFLKKQKELKLKNNLKDEYRLAYKFGNRKLRKTIKSYGAKSSYGFIFNSINAGFSTAFNLNDYMSYFQLGISDVRYNFEFYMNFGTRFKRKAILEQISENTFYQKWERRNVLSLGLRKNLRIAKVGALNVNIFLASDLQWHWARYAGFDKTIGGEFRFVPEGGISLYSGILVLDISYQYANYEIYKISPHRIKIGLTSHILFKNADNKYTPRWIE